MAHDPTAQGPEGAAATPEDLAYLAEIDAEFAELEAEIERISAMPASQSQAKIMMLKHLREQWQSKADDRADKPLWRQKIDAAVGPALEKILEDSLVDDGTGKLSFALSNQALETHGKPMLMALVEGFKDMLTEKVAKATPEERAKSPFMAALAVLVGQLSGGLSKVQSAPKGEAAGAAKGETLFEGERDVSASFEGRFEPESAQQANDAGKVLFQTLLQGLGQVMNAMGTQVKAGMASAKAADTPTGDEKPGGVPGKTPDADGATEKPGAAPDKGATGEADPGPVKKAAPKINIDFAGMFGALLKQGAMKVQAKPAPKPEAEAPEAPAVEADDDDDR